jgi:hypothetical protein
VKYAPDFVLHSILKLVSRIAIKSVMDMQNVNYALQFALLIIQFVVIQEFPLFFDLLSRKMIKHEIQSIKALQIANDENTDKSIC